MSGRAEIPSKQIKSFSFLLVAVKELLNGFDNGSGFIKLPLWLVGFSVTAFFAPYVLAGGGVFAAIYLARAVYEEHKRNKLEQEKILERNGLAIVNLQAEAEFVSAIKQTLLLENDIQFYIQQEKAKKTSASKIAEQVQATLQAKFTKAYPTLQQDTPTSKSNAQLLKNVLRDYFVTLNSVNCQVNKVPDQHKMLSLIQDVTGYNPNKPNFHKKMQALLADDVELQAKFHTFVSLGQTGQNTPKSNLLKKAWHWFKQQKTIRKVTKIGIDFFVDFTTGAGITAALLGLFGVIAASIPLTWPIIAAIVVSGLTFAIISLAYQRVSADRAKSNIHHLDEEIKQQKIKYALTKRLLKLKKNPKQLQEKAHQFAIAEEGLEAENVPQVHKVSIPLSVKVRIGLSLACQIIAGISLGLLTAYGFVWIGTIFFPALPILIPTLGLEGLFSFYYVYRGVKAGIKNHQAELKQIKRVAEQTSYFQQKYRSNETVQQDLQRDNKTLLKETIQQYLVLLHNKEQNGLVLKGRPLPQQEKIFSVIEKITGIQRETGEDGRVLATGTDKFYNELANYLKGKLVSSKEANALVQEFKSKFYQPVQNPLLTDAKVNADDPTINIKPSRVNKVGSFMNKYTLGFIGAVTVGIMLPLFLIGPQFALVGAVAAIVLGGYLLSQYLSYRAEKNLAKLTAKEARLELIDKKHKLIHRNQQFQSHRVKHKLAVVTSEDAKLKAQQSVKPAAKQVAITAAGRPDGYQKLGDSMSHIWSTPDANILPCTELLIKPRATSVGA